MCIDIVALNISNITAGAEFTILGDFLKGEVKYMPIHAERRKYQRCDSIICKAQMSIDEKRWVISELVDLSAGGLSFASSNSSFNEGCKVYFNLYVYNMLSEFNIKLEGSIIRIDRNNSKRLYSVKFENINKYQQVQLDELVKSKITICDRHNGRVFEEEHSIFLFPKLSPRTNRIRLRNYK